MSGNSERTVIIFADGVLPLRSPAKAKFSELVKLHMAETGKNQRWAEFAVALTPEGLAAWEEARKLRMNKRTVF